MQTAKLPYEFLARWNQDGTLSGAHVQWRYVTKDGDMVVAESVSAAECVAVGSTNGFPLADVLTNVQTDAIAGMDAARAAQTTAKSALAQKTAEYDQLTAALTAETAAKDAALQEVSRLTSAAQDVPSPED